MISMAWECGSEIFGFVRAIFFRFARPSDLGVARGGLLRERAGGPRGSGIGSKIHI
jgi:hypothetical protein